MIDKYDATNKEDTQEEDLWDYDSEKNTLRREEDKEAAREGRGMRENLAGFVGL